MLYMIKPVQREADVKDDHITYVCEASVDSAVLSFMQDFKLDEPAIVYKKETGRNVIYIPVPPGFDPLNFHNISHD